jgi:hypothetical protein
MISILLIHIAAPKDLNCYLALTPISILHIHHLLLTAAGGRRVYLFTPDNLSGQHIDISSLPGILYRP